MEFRNTKLIIEALKQIPSFKYKLTKQQKQIMTQQGNLIVAGRSGTGKTTCAMLRLFGVQFTLKIKQIRQMNAKNPQLLNNTCKMAQFQNLTAGRNVILTYSSLLIQEIKRLYQNMILKIKQKHSKKCQLCKQILKNKIKQKEQSQNIKEYKNKNSKKKRIQSLDQMNLDKFPAFLTIQLFLKMLDTTIQRPFFYNQQQNGFRKNKYVKELTYINKYQYKADWIPQTTFQAVFINYQFFCQHIWPSMDKTLIKLVKTQKLLSTSVIWAQIFSVIKGSVDAYTCPEGFLSLKMYLPEKRNVFHNYNKQEIIELKKIVYDIFLEYKKWCQNNNGYDLMDLVTHLLRQTQLFGYPGPEMNYMFIDQVQDLTSSTIFLLSKLTKNNIFYCGDTAQAITKGVNFRFQDIKYIFNQQYCKNSIKMDTPPEVITLTVNLRSQNEILQLANTVISAIQEIFPKTVSKEKKEVSKLVGPKPFLNIYKNDELLIQLFCGADIRKAVFDKQYNNRINGALNPNQIIIVRNNHQKQKLPKYHEQSIVLIPEEAKGLQFEQIVIYNFFSSSRHHDKWDILDNLYPEMEQQEEEQFYQGQFEQFEQQWSNNNSGNYLIKYLIKKAKAYPSLKSVNLNLYFELVNQLKLLYTMITRARSIICIYDSFIPASLLAYWQKFDALIPLTEKNINKNYEARQKYIQSINKKFDRSDQKQHWQKQGKMFMDRKLLQLALTCYRRANNKQMVQQIKALLYEKQADDIFFKIRYEKYTEKMSYLKGRQQYLYQEAAVIFQELGLIKQAGNVYFKNQQFEKAASCFSFIQMFDREAQCYEVLKEYEKAGDIYLKINILKLAIKNYFESHSEEKIMTIVISQSSQIKCQLTQNEQKYFLNKLLKYNSKFDSIFIPQFPLSNYYTRSQNIQMEEEIDQIIDKFNFKLRVQTQNKLAIYLTKLQQQNKQKIKYQSKFPQQKEFENKDNFKYIQKQLIKMNKSIKIPGTNKFQHKKMMNITFIKQNETVEIIKIKNELSEIQRKNKLQSRNVNNFSLNSQNLQDLTKEESKGNYFDQQNKMRIFESIQWQKLKAIKNIIQLSKIYINHNLMHKKQQQFSYQLLEQTLKKSIKAQNRQQLFQQISICQIINQPLSCLIICNQQPRLCSKYLLSFFLEFSPSYHRKRMLIRNDDDQKQKINNDYEYQMLNLISNLKKDIFSIKIPKGLIEDNVLYTTIGNQIVEGLILQGFYKHSLLFCDQQTSLSIKLQFLQYPQILKQVNQMIKKVPNYILSEEKRKYFQNLKYLFVDQSKIFNCCGQSLQQLNVRTIQAIFNAFDQCQEVPILNKRINIQNLTLSSQTIYNIQNNIAKAKLKKLKQKRKFTNQVIKKKQKQKADIQIIISDIQNNIKIKNQICTLIQKGQLEQKKLSYKSIDSKKQQLDPKEQLMKKGLRFLQLKINQQYSKGKQNNSQIKGIKQQIKQLQFQIRSTVIFPLFDYLIEKIEIFICQSEKNKTLLTKCSKKQTKMQKFFVETDENKLQIQERIFDQIKKLKDRLIKKQDKSQKIKKQIQNLSNLIKKMKNNLQSEKKQINALNQEKALSELNIQQINNQIKLLKSTQQMQFQFDPNQENNYKLDENILIKFKRQMFAQAKRKLNQENRQQLINKTINSILNKSNLKSQQNTFLTWYIDRNNKNSFRKINIKDVKLIINEYNKSIQQKNGEQICNIIIFFISFLFDQHFKNTIYNIIRQFFLLQKLKSFLRNIFKIIKIPKINNQLFFGIFFGFFQCRLIKKTSILSYLALQYVIVRNNSFLENKIREAKFTFKYYFDQQCETILCSIKDVHQIIIDFVEKRYNNVCEFLKIKNQFKQNDVLSFDQIKLEIFFQQFKQINKQSKRLFQNRLCDSPQNQKILEKSNYQNNFKKGYFISDLNLLKKEMLSFYFESQFKKPEIFFFIFHHLKQYSLIQKTYNQMNIYNQQLIDVLINQIKMLQKQYKLWIQTLGKDF